MPFQATGYSCERNGSLRPRQLSLQGQPLDFFPPRNFCAQESRYDHEATIGKTHVERSRQPSRQSRGPSRSIDELRTPCKALRELLKFVGHRETEGCLRKRRSLLAPM